MNRPRADPIFVSLDRVRHCPEEIAPEEFWPSRPDRRKADDTDWSPQIEFTTLEEDEAQDTTVKEAEKIYPWEGRLRSRRQDWTRTPDTLGGDM